LGDAETPTPDVLAESVRAFADRIAGLGKAEMGDKTMMDALLPFAASLEERIASGIPVEEAWAVAATDASAAAAYTADLRPLKGRARPLAEKSLGTPDPGATSLAMVFTAVGPHFTAVPVAAVTN
jgi:dihydroxyacetone kinase